MGWPTASVLIAVVVGFAVESMFRTYLKNRYYDEPEEDEMTVRNEEIAEARADEAQARVEATAARLGERASMLEAHAEGLHDDAPREFCPECERRGGRA